MTRVAEVPGASVGFRVGRAWTQESASVEAGERKVFISWSCVEHPDLRRLRQQQLGRHLPAILSSLGIALSNPGAVVDYLALHEELAEIVLSVASEAAKLTGPGGAVELQLYEDPEVDDRYLELVLRATDYGSGLRAKLDALDRLACELQVGSSGWMVVTTDFRPPGAGRWPSTGPST